MFAKVVKKHLRSVMPRTEEALARLIGVLTGASAVVGLTCSMVVAVGS